MAEDENKRPGRRRIKKEPHKVLTASIPETLYDDFQEAVHEHGGGNMTLVIKRLVDTYVKEKKQSQ